MESKKLFEQIDIQRQFNQWEIKLNIYLDSIILKIENEFNIYESSFNLVYLQSFQLLSSNHSMNEMIDCLLNYIDNHKIRIEKKENKLKLIFFSNNISKMELIINEKNKLCEEIIEKLIKEIKSLKEDNKKLIKEIKSLKEDNKTLKLKIEKKEKEEKMNKLNEKKIKQLKYNFIKKPIIQITNCNLKEVNSINSHINNITLLSTFFSGNIISVSSDKSIKIYDKNLKIIQNIENAHDDGIIDLSIKDENNFVTCSKNKEIKTWIKKENNGQFNNEYSINQIIENAHDDWINKVIYCLNGNIISCSDDKKIKIWEQNNNNQYQSVKILKHNNWISSILLLEDKNLLISSGRDGTKFWDLNYYEIIIYIKEVICRYKNALKRIDEYRIIVGGDDDEIMKIVSIKERKIIKEIKNGFKCWGICIIEEKGLFLIGGVSKEIKIYRSDNYECINIINNAHNDDILGISELKNGLITSYGKDKIIKVWSFS